MQSRLEITVISRRADVKIYYVYSIKFYFALVIPCVIGASITCVYAIRVFYILYYIGYIITPAYRALYVHGNNVIISGRIYYVVLATLQ